MRFGINPEAHFLGAQIGAITAKRSRDSSLATLL
jgi:hypothetical protein